MQMKRKKNQYYTLIFVITALLCAIACASMLLTMQYRQWKANELYASLSESTMTASGADINESGDGSAGEEAAQVLTGYQTKCLMLYEQYGISVPDRNIDFDKLRSEVSEDIYAWIYIPNTNVDYPVLQHPEDNSYYLEYNLDGSRGYPGCIYTENYNSKNFDDRHTVIYGHNMRDGTMFSDLHKYEEEDFFRDNPYVYIYTPEDIFVYRIFAAYETGNAHLLLSFNLASDEMYMQYLGGILAQTGDNCIIDRNTPLGTDSKLLTLSTCVMAERQYHLRYLVQGVLMEAE